MLNESQLRRFWSKVDMTDSCWLWKGRLEDGYGRMRVANRMIRVHRISHLTYIGTISKWYQVDHLCRNRACVRPSHLEAVTQAENHRRAFLDGRWRNLNDKCKNGHTFDARNVYTTKEGYRKCVRCRQSATKRYEIDNKPARNARSLKRYHVNKEVSVS